MSEETVPEKTVTFNIKSSSDAKYTLTLPLSTTVADLKTKLSTSEYADIPATRQRLIYSGRVLKDPDTLETVKLKDGNTVHLVKGAASNERQNPANQGTAAGTAAAAGSGGAATGVPQNLAAGTGNDVLAGLTGARYAGHAQLPSLGMFGADGGMGAPPGPDQMAHMLEDPQFANMLDSALSNPQLVDMMIQQNPQLRNQPGIREMLQDPNFRRMATDPQFLRMAGRMRSQMMGGGADGAFPMPGVTDQTQTPGATGQNQPRAAANPFDNPFGMLFGNPAMAGTAAAPSQTPVQTPPAPASAGQEAPNTAAGQAPAANPFANLFAQMAAGQTGAPGAAPAAGDAAANPFANPMFQNPQFMAEMMRMMNGGAAPVPADTRPPEERYETQLRQLNEMGFHNFDHNVAALRRAGGSVEGAVEMLFNNPDQAF